MNVHIYIYIYVGEGLLAAKHEHTAALYGLWLSIDVLTPQLPLLT